MSCSNCYNGCGTPIPYSCIKYTGPDLVDYDLETGDPISMFFTSLKTKVDSALNGTGIVLSTTLCKTLSDLLSTDEKNLANLMQVYADAICDIKTEVADIDTIVNQPYSFSTSCLDDLPSNPSRDDILQATIQKVCSLNTTVTTVNNDYVKATDLNNLIQQYLDNVTPDTPVFQNSAKMVPYVAYEYYGPLSNFDSSGKGLAANGFDKVYLCNGSNGTPDKRGRVAVGAIQGVPGGALDAEVDPTLPANPSTNYTLGQKFGKSYVTLDLSQIPSHSHSVTDPGHVHSVVSQGRGDNGLIKLAIGDNNNFPSQTTEPATTGISIGNAGGGQYHENRQPSIAAYYIMYIP